MVVASRSGDGSAEFEEVATACPATVVALLSVLAVGIGVLSCCGTGLSERWKDRMVRKLIPRASLGEYKSGV